MFLGKYPGTEPAGAYAFQGGWALVLPAAGRALQSGATRGVVVRGG